MLFLWRCNISEGLTLEYDAEKKHFLNILGVREPLVVPISQKKKKKIYMST
jgi:hypothetical protein